VYDRSRHPPLSRPDFIRRVLPHVLAAVAPVLASLGIGMAGHAGFEGRGWLDALLNAAMLLGGMGPVGEIRFPAGKLFASGFALYAGIVFLGVTALLFAPLYHRWLHRFHLEQRRH